jgi:flagellar basal-body rod protein FlgB
MIGKLDESLQFNSNALKLRAERQQLLSANIANADTPNYKAADFDFARALAAATGVSSGAAAGRSFAVVPLRAQASDSAHIAGRVALSSNTPLLYRAPSQSSLDGNSVEMDAERAQFADNAVRYEAALRFLNGQIKTMLSAIQG